MADAGMSNPDILRSAIWDAAVMLRQQTKIGSLEPGKFADIVAVVGNPLEDVRVFNKGVVFVMKDGKVYVYP